MIYPKIPLLNKNLLVKFIPYAIILALLVYILITFNTNKQIKKSIKSTNKELKVLEKEIKQNLIDIYILKVEYDSIKIPNVDSALNYIDEKNYTFVDSMSVSELKQFLLTGQR